LLGGVIIRAGDLVIVVSASGRLKRLSDALQS
ncbi:F0F1 ATP synthase subunit delta, partial [Vibrio parahaemolyticus]